MRQDRHDLAVFGIRFPIATCTCGWVSDGHKSRGEARRAWDGHMTLIDRRSKGRYAVGVDAHRKDLSGDPEGGK